MPRMDLACWTTYGVVSVLLGVHGLWRLFLTPDNSNTYVICMLGSLIAEGGIICSIPTNSIESPLPSITEDSQWPRLGI